ncbi:MAG: Ger(x)C family spore germination protein [Bacillota bacterium]|nr:Ger(x)C family spore germination protein [Bacillota bacterium]
MRKRALMMLFLVPFLQTGCWDTREVDRLASVLAFGIDRIPGNEPILLTVQIATPDTAKGGNKDVKAGGKAFTVMSSKGKTFSDAIHNLGSRSMRKVFFSHSKLIVLGKDLAETGIGEIIDDLKRDREFRRIDWILTTDMTAKEILEHGFSMEQIPSKGLDQILQESKESGLILPVNCNDFFVRLNGDSHVSFTPLVQLVDIDKQMTSQLEEVAGRPLESEVKPKTLTVAKTVIYKNQQMIGELNENESKALMWLVDSPKGGFITYTFAPEASTNGEKGKISLDISDGKTIITPQISDNSISISIVCNAKASIIEAETVGIDILNPMIVAQLEAKAAETLKLQLEQIIDKAQKELKSDCVGFAEHLHTQYPVAWKRVKNNWEDIFPTIEYHVSCEVRILNTGMINNTLPTNEAGGIN